VGLANSGGTSDPVWQQNKGTQEVVQQMQVVSQICYAIDSIWQSLASSPHHISNLRPRSLGACSEYYSDLNSNPARSAMQWSSGSSKLHRRVWVQNPSTVLSQSD